MKTGWTTHSWNGAIWLALSSCHMTMTCKINKLEKPGGPLGIFHALFGRSAAFYGHFRVDAVTSEWSTRISASTPHLPKQAESNLNASHQTESNWIWFMPIWYLPLYQSSASQFTTISQLFYITVYIIIQISQNKHCLLH